MSRSRILSLCVPLIATIALVVGLGAHDATSAARGSAPEALTLDCPGGLIVDVSFARAEGRPSRSASVAAAAAADDQIADHDAITAVEGHQVVRSGDRTVAVIDTVKDGSGYAVGGIEACAADYISP